MRTVPFALLRGNVWRRPLTRLSLLALGWSLAAAAAAADVRVLTADAFRPVVAAMTPLFEKRTGHRLVVMNDTVDALARRIRQGEDFDVAILPPPLLEELGKEGDVSEGSIIPLARTPAGPQGATLYAGAVSSSASDSQAALSLLILLASEDTQLILKDKGLAAP
jgi:molybdate transport system substrate-binding protein